MGVASSVDTGSRVELVRSFASLGRDDLAYAGGKGANLGERRPILTWGTRSDEALAQLPGDELLEDADGVSTRAIGHPGGG